ncbi:MAG: hypothetical protein ACXV8T_01760 [Acidimicrobiia bacterium]
MEAFVVAGAGFLLAVLWFDLMFDVQVRKLPVTAATVQSISTYYRRVTTEARPMNNLVAVAMLGTLVAVGAELLDQGSWTARVSVVFVLVPVVLARGRTVPAAVRLGRAEDDLEMQLRIARTILVDHLICLVCIATVIVVQLVAAAD